VGVRRETASAYLRAAGIPVRARGGAATEWPPKPATSEGGATDPGQPKPATGEGVSTDSAPRQWPAPGRAPAASACEPYRELIDEALAGGRNAMAIYQDLVDDHGFAARYASVKRYVRKLRGETVPEARVVITTAPGEEAQVDYGEGPMVRERETGSWRSTRSAHATSRSWWKTSRRRSSRPGPNRSGRARSLQFAGCCIVSSRRCARKS